MIRNYDTLDLMCQARNGLVNRSAHAKHFDARDASDLATNPHFGHEIDCDGRRCLGFEKVGLVVAGQLLNDTPPVRTNGSFNALARV